MGWTVLIFVFIALLAIGGITVFYGLVARDKTTAERITAILSGAVIIAVTGYAGYHLFNMLPK